MALSLNNNIIVSRPQCYLTQSQAALVNVIIIDSAIYGIKRGKSRCIYDNYEDEEAF